MSKQAERKPDFWRKERSTLWILTPSFAFLSQNSSGTLSVCGMGGGKNGRSSSFLLGAGLLTAIKLLAENGRAESQNGGQTIGCPTSPRALSASTHNRFAITFPKYISCTRKRESASVSRKFFVFPGSGEKGGSFSLALPTSFPLPSQRRSTT